MTKPVFRVCLTQTGRHSFQKKARSFKPWNFGFKKKSDCTIRVAKTKALISFTAPLFSLRQKIQFSHDAVHIILMFDKQSELLLLKSSTVLS